MPYFDSFPTIQYDIDKTNETISLTNILKRTSIIPNVKDNLALFTNYDYKDVDRLEIISHKLYDDSELHWIIMLMNDVINPHYDLPISELALSEYVDAKYPEQTFFMSGNTTSSSSSSGYDGFTNMDGSYTTDEYVRTNTIIHQGTAMGGSLNTIKLASDSSSIDRAYNGCVVSIDSGTGSPQTVYISDYDGESRIATLETALSEHISCDTTYIVYTSARVYSFDASYARLILTDIVGTFAVSDIIYSVSSSSGVSGAIQRKVSESRSALHHFEDATTGKWHDPYDSDIQYLAGYILNAESTNITASIVTNLEYETAQNDNKRFIKLLDRQLVATAVADFNRLMRE